MLFTLYDTYGFPVDLAQEVLEERGFAVTPETQAEYDQEMEAQRERARSSATFGGGGGGAPTGDESPAAYQTLLADVPKAEFLGYEAMTAPARILAMVAGGRRRREAVAGDEVEVILDRTPFYAESGGQIGDTGVISGRQGRGDVVDTQYRGAGLIAHRLRVTEGGFREGEDVAVSVESPRRQGLRLHHTGTHLLHAALRKVLGTHVTQAGSLVAPDRLRFDFTHAKPVKDRDLERVEDLVNEAVRENITVDPFWTDLDAALRMGAMALFGEKYGEPRPRHPDRRLLDRALRRDAPGRHRPDRAVQGHDRGGRRLRRPPPRGGHRERGPRARRARRSRRSARRPISCGSRRSSCRAASRSFSTTRRASRSSSPSWRRASRRAAPRTWSRARARWPACRWSSPASTGSTRRACARWSIRCASASARASIVLGAVTDGSTSLIGAITKDLVGRVPANKLIQEVAKVVGGGGGGRPDLAQAGGKNPAELDRALAGVYDLVARAAGG